MENIRPFFQHANAIVEEGAHIGVNTKIWAFAHILPGATIGEDCNICDSVFIESKVTVGNRVTIKCGVQLWDGLRVEDDVFIGPNATFTNDPFPRSKKYPEAYPITNVLKGASIGANATILPGLTIGQNAMVGAGSVVTKSIPPNAIVCGNPAKIVGYSTNQQRKVEPIKPETNPNSQITSKLQIGKTDSYLYRLPRIKDLRGELSFTEFGQDLPFIVNRCFWVFDVPSSEVRGEHAHKECEEFLICVAGQVSVIVDDGTHQAEVVLNQPELALHLPPGHWIVLYKYSPDAVLMVLTSHSYDASDYIRDYDQFLTYKNLK